MHYHLHSSLVLDAVKVCYGGSLHSFHDSLNVMAILKDSSEHHPETEGCTEIHHLVYRAEDITAIKASKVFCRCNHERVSRTENRVEPRIECFNSL